MVTTGLSMVVEWFKAGFFKPLVSRVIQKCNLYTAKIEDCYYSCVVISVSLLGIFKIIQFYRSSTMNSLHRDVYYRTASQSCMLLIIVMIQNMKLK